MNFVFISSGIPKLLAKRVCNMVGKPAKDIRLLYITTPANTYPVGVDWAMKAIVDIKNQGFAVVLYDIQGKTKGEVQGLVNKADIVWVSGGNVFYFLYWAKKVGLKKILHEFLQKGGVYAGESAGIVCHIKDLEPIKWIDHPEKAPKLITEGMQLTDLVVLPHSNHPKYGPDILKIRDYYEKKGLSPYLLKDGEALIIKDDRIEKI